MNRILSSVALAFICLFPVYGQMAWNAKYQNYFNQYKDLAIEQMLKYRIPASITLAQGVFESGAGYSDLGTKWQQPFRHKMSWMAGAKDLSRRRCPKRMLQSL